MPVPERPTTCATDFGGYTNPRQPLDVKPGDLLGLRLVFKLKGPAELAFNPVSKLLDNGVERLFIAR